MFRSSHRSSVSSPLNAVCLRLSDHHTGRALLHVVAYLGSRKHFRWHMACAQRELSRGPRPPGGGAPGPLPAPAGSPPAAAPGPLPRITCRCLPGRLGPAR